ncbi:hypothetical protein HYH02_008798 [Chlamydomonas schloesseri]|uniref:Vesicle tethering protein Uso1/P115-like head domain-containing protein n=1 Tax=Chlamydomonas schloesseri TaxID=2026947 RepID=A0A835WDD1_9CHLO|nr:hypothetical protein HYH02_008798 [Chlamydomonas schloesseri]|eukprot:KAG2445332.1 hypothetical protein HYH02_008798 [Chlamydomonas schloesseri]
MLGRLGAAVKGVGGLAKNVAGAALGEARSALTAVPNDEVEVENLLQRISGSLMPEYRRQAMSQLKDLLLDNPKAQMAFGSMGVPILMAVLRDDRDDVALLQSTLESLVAATTGGGHDAHRPDHPHHVSAAEAHAAALNAEVLARQREHIGLLLGLLEDEPVGVSDFYVRYHTVQLLTALLNHCPTKLQEAILATPMSVVRLTELLGERSEIIRNEALLLLVALTRMEGAGAGGAGAGAPGGASEVQKIAAFEGAFDRVAELLREEGGLDGGMVVQDCIELMNNLLRGNLANQRLFREMGHSALLPQLVNAALPGAAAGRAGAGSGGKAGGAADGGGGSSFATAAGPIPFGAANGGGGAAELTGDAEAGVELGNALAALAAAGGEALLGPAGALPRQKAANMLGLMQTLRLLCSPPTAAADPDRAAEVANRTANQAKLLAGGMLEALLGAALQDGGVGSAAVRAAALGALGDLVAGNAPAQERLAKSVVRPGGAAAASAADGQAAAAAAAAAADGAPPSEQQQAPVAALTAALRVALHGGDAGERAAADHVITCYCRGNAEGQSALAGGIGPRPAAHAPGYGLSHGHAAPPHGHGPHDPEQRAASPAGLHVASFGQELVAALVASSTAMATSAQSASAAATAAAAAAAASALNAGYRPYGASAGGAAGAATGSSSSSSSMGVAVRAATALQHLLLGNAAVKLRLLSVPLDSAAAPPGVPPDLLMPRVVRTLTAALRPPCGDAARVVVCSFLRLLLVWLTDCPPAISALLDGAAHVPLLVDLVTGRQGPAASSAASSAAAAAGGSATGTATPSGPASGHLTLPPYGGPPGVLPSSSNVGGAGAAASGAGSAAGSGDPVVCGLAACVLAACLVYGKPSAAAAAAHAAGAPAAPSPSDLVLDVIMSRVGLSHFFYRLDDFRRSPMFAAAAAAAAAGTAAKPLTRAAAAAAVAAAEQQAAAAAAAAAAGAAGGAAAEGVGSFQLGPDVVSLVGALEEAVRVRTMDVFSRPTGHKPGGAQDGLPSTPAEVPGADDASRLGWAVTALGRLAREVDELRGRNRALAEDLFRMSQNQGALPPAAGSAAPGQHGHGGPGGAGPHSGPGLGGAAPGPVPGAAGSAADVEARVALELRASRAEQELAALRHQVEVMGARLGQAEADAAAAREAAATAHLAATKAEADLADLSGAYNNLESHAFSTEAQLRTAQTALAAAQAAAQAAEARAAQAAQHAAAAAPGHGPAGGVPEAEVARRVEEAAAAARAAAEAEADEGMTDLLVCLGQEERKVQVLSEALAAQGVDVDAILATLAEEEEAGAGGQEGQDGGDELR